MTVLQNLGGYTWDQLSGYTLLQINEFPYITEFWTVSSAFGNSTFVMNVSPSDIDPTSAIGDYNIGHLIAASGFQNTSYGTTIMKMFLLPNGMPNGNIINSPSVMYIVVPDYIASTIDVNEPIMVHIIGTDGISDTSFGDTTMVMFLDTESITLENIINDPELYFVIVGNNFLSSNEFGTLEMQPGPVWAYPEGVSNVSMLSGYIVGHEFRPLNILLEYVVRNITVEVNE